MTGPPPGGRGNGLPPSAGWIPLAECDPRVADALLSELAAVRIAAYASPSQGVPGGYLERQLPRRPLDRLFVDSARSAEARAVVGSRMDPSGSPPDAAPPDEDAAFAAIVAGFGQASGLGGWPASEELSRAAGEGADEGTEGPGARERRGRRATGPGDGKRGRRPAHPSGGEPGLLDPGGLLYDSALGDGTPRRPADPFADDDNHYQPPPVGPLPPVHPLTRAAVVAIVAGVLCLLAPALGLFADAQAVDLLGAALIAGGVITLVLRMRDGPRDDTPDDGAVV